MADLYETDQLAAKMKTLADELETEINSGGHLPSCKEICFDISSISTKLGRVFSQLEQIHNPPDNDNVTPLRAA